MSERLIVALFDEPCGALTSVAGSLEYSFAYEQRWRPGARYGISLCLRGEGAGSALAARAYFGGLLPEGAARRHIAQSRGIDELDDIALLKLLGRECPGAVSVLTSHSELRELASRRGGSPEIEWLDTEAARELVRGLRLARAARAAHRYSISLAGAQLKRGVVVDAESGQLGLPLGATLSTHILKLAVPGYPGVVENEHATQQLAAACGLEASTSSVVEVGGERALLVRRYDRVAGGRLHQEDMCQALGQLSAHKYERYDPETATAVGPGVADMVELLRRAARPSVQQIDALLRQFWFNVIVGNADAHAKNYSLLYSASLDGFEIAPLYDSICVTALHADVPHSERVQAEPLPMHVGGQTHFWRLSAADVRAHARSVRVQPAYLMRSVRRLVERVQAELDGVIDARQADHATQHPALEDVRSEIHARCEHLLSVLTAP